MRELSSLSDSKLISRQLLAKNVVWNLLGRVAPLIAAIFSIPAIIRNLGVDRFGILTLVWMIIGYFSLFDMGLGRALTKLISDKLGGGKNEDIVPLIWTGLILMLIFGFVGACIGAMFSSSMVKTVLKVPLDLQMDTLITLYLLVISLPIVIITNGLRGILEAYQRFGLINAINVPMGVFSFLAPLLVLPFSHHLVPIVLTLIIGRFAGVLIYLLGCYHVIPEMRHGFSFQLSMMKPLLGLGSWMTLTNIIGPLMVYLDRFMIGAFISITYLAYYTTPYEVVTKLWIIPGAVVGVLFPAFAVCFAQDKDRTTLLFIKSVNHVFLILFPITLIIVTLSHDVLNLWLGNEFALKSTAILQWLAVGVFINSIGQLPYTLIQSAGRPDLTAKLHLIELPIYLLMIWLMLNKYGIEGAAIAWTLRAAIDTVLLLCVAKHMLPGKPIVYYLKTSATVAAISLLVLFIATLLKGMLIKWLFLFSVLIIFAILSWFLILAPRGRKFTQIWSK